MKPRPYQSKAEELSFAEWDNGSASTLIVMPTGTGKTIVIAGIILRNQPKRTMVIAHRQELIWQAKDKIQRVTNLVVDIEMGEYRSRSEGDLLSPKASVIVSSIQTLVSGGDGAGRIGKFNPMDFDLLIIDEAHHATSSSYQKVIDYFKTNPALKILGVTATPDRSDEEALGQIFDTVAFDYEILDAINDGWLVPIEQQMVSIESLDFSSVRTQGNDLNGSDLNAVMVAEKNLHGIASSTIDIIGNRRGIGFAASVAHAESLCEIFNRHRTGMSGVVSAKTDPDERKKIISDFAQGKIQWLWNCGVFTEGFDDSGVEVISMARPTKSRALYAQMAGRGTRPHETIAHKLNNAPMAALRRVMIARSVKPTCLIIDHVGNSGKHKLITTADILGGNVSEEVIEAATAVVRNSGKQMRMDKVLVDEEERLAEKKQKKLTEEARKAKLLGKATFKSTKIDPFSLFDIKPISNERGWDKGKMFTEKQRDFLKKRGYNPDEMDYARGKQLIGIIMDRLDKKPCTVKQADILKRFGVDAVSGVTFDQASSMIDQIAKNNWTKPAQFKLPETKPPEPTGYIAPEDDNVPF